MRDGTRIGHTDGSSQTARFDKGQYFNAGPARLPSHHQTILGYCREFGVALEAEVNTSHSAYFLPDAAKHRPAGWWSSCATAPPAWPCR